MIGLLYFLQFFFGLVFRFTPPRAAVGLMRLAGNITFQIARLTPVKRTVSDNYRAFFPEADAAALADGLLYDISQSIFEVLCFPFFKDSHFSLVCRLEGKENLDQAFASGTGVLLLTMHTGNYELMLVLIPHLGYPVNPVMKAPVGDPLFDLINRSRAATGSKLINVESSNMYRESLARLADHEIVGIMLDTGARESRHETVVFLGKKMPAATGWLTLAQRSAAALCLVTCRRENDKLVVGIEPPFQITAANREEKQEEVRRHFDNFVRAHPDQWALFLNKDEIGRILDENK